MGKDRLDNRILLFTGEGWHFTGRSAGDDSACIALLMRLDQSAQRIKIQVLPNKGGGQCDEAALEGMDHGRAGWEE